MNKTDENQTGILPKNLQQLNDAISKSLFYDSYHRIKLNYIYNLIIDVTSVEQETKPAKNGTERLFAFLGKISTIDMKGKNKPAQFIEYNKFKVIAFQMTCIKSLHLYARSCGLDLIKQQFLKIDELKFYQASEKDRPKNEYFCSIKNVKAITQYEYNELLKIPTKINYLKLTT